MKLHFFATILLAVTILSACTEQTGEPGATFKPETILANCDKALNEKDLKAAARECPFAEQWLAREKPDSLLYAQAQEKLGDFLLNANLKAATDHYTKALDILEKQAAEPATLASLQFKLANVLSTQGKWPDAELAWKKTLRVREKAQGAESLDVADVLNRLGVAQLQQSLLADAEQSLRRAMTIRESKDADGNALGEIYNNLGYMYQLMGKDQDAESFYRKALFNQESSQVTPYPALYDSVSNLAALLQKQNKSQDAESYWKKTLTVAEKGFGKQSVQYANALNSLGMLALSERNHTVAEKLFMDVLTIREKLLGVNHLQTAEAANNLAVAFANQNKKSQALPLLRHAVAVTQVSLGATNPLTQQRWQNLQNLQSLSNANIAAPQQPQKPAAPNPPASKQKH